MCDSKPSKDSENRKRTISVRVSNDEYTQLNDYAMYKGMTVSSYLRHTGIVVKQTHAPFFLDPKLLLVRELVSISKALRAIALTQDSMSASPDTVDELIQLNIDTIELIATSEATLTHEGGGDDHQKDPDAT